MNSLPSDNRQMVNAFLVKSHKSFGLLGSVPSIIEPKSIFYIFKISSDILKSQLLYQIPPSIFTKKYYCFRKGQTNPRRRFSHSGRKLTSSRLLTVMTLWCLLWRITVTPPQTRLDLTLPSRPQNTSATSVRST